MRPATYLEYVALSALVVGFPDPHPLLAARAATLTAAKFTLYALAAATAATEMWMARRTAAGRDHATGERT